jgi:hypothetical protein
MSLGIPYKARHIYNTTQSKRPGLLAFASLCVCQRRATVTGARKEGRAKFAGRRKIPSSSTSGQRLVFVIFMYAHHPTHHHHRHNPQHLEEGEGVAYAGGCFWKLWASGAGPGSNIRKARQHIARGPRRPPCRATSVMPLFLKKKEAPTSRIFHVSYALGCPLPFYLSL